MDGFDSSPRLPTLLWIEAEMRRLQNMGIGVYLAARGDKTGGLVIQKISDMTGNALVLGQERDVSGRLGWVNLLAQGEDAVTEDMADSYIARALKRDPDLWVVEIEDKSLLARLNPSS